MARLLAALSLLCCGLATANTARAQGAPNLAVDLRLIPENPIAGQTVAVEVSVRNQGPGVAKLIRWRSGMEVTADNFFGWSLTLVGPGARRHFHPMAPGAAPTLRDEDVIELRPHESFATIVALPIHPVGVEFARERAGLDAGEYSLEASYALVVDPDWNRRPAVEGVYYMAGLPTDLEVGPPDYFGPLRSRRVVFVVEK